MKQDREKIKVALIYDFDGTLAPGNMQEYDFIPAVGKSNAEFWEESNRIANESDSDPILTYMLMMIEGAKGKGLSINRDAMRNAGKNISYFRGVEEWFDRINVYAEQKGIEVLHYVNSSGILEIIEGTSISDRFRKIYACSFLYDSEGNAYWPGVAVNYTTKTQFIYKINKGVESVSDIVRVNQYMEEDKRPVPFKHMIYIGDGTTDIPSMRVVQSQGGYSIAVYNPDAKEGRSVIEHLLKEKRVSHICPADYREGGEMDELVKTIIDKIEVDYRIKLLSQS